MFEIGKRYKVLKGFYDYSGFISDNHALIKDTIIKIVEMSTPEPILDYFSITLDDDRMLLMGKSWEKYLFEHDFLKEI